MIKNGNIQFNKEDVEYIVRFLNDILEDDRYAITSLFLHRVDCNNKLAEHQTAQALQQPDKTNVVGILGLINGLCGIDKDGWGPITLVFNDDTLEIEKFEVTEKFDWNNYSTIEGIITND